MYLVSICKLFETNEQRNRKRGGKGLYSKPIENTDVNKLTKQDINEFLKSEWFNKLTNHTKNQHLIRIKKYLKFSNREDLVEEIVGLLFKEEKRILSMALDAIARTADLHGKIGDNYSNVNSLPMDISFRFGERRFNYRAEIKSINSISNIIHLLIS